MNKHSDKFPAIERSLARVVILAVGDILINRPDPEHALAGIADILSAADVAIGNFEGVLTADQAPSPGCSEATITHPNNAGGLSLFSVLSLANNHSLDCGYDGLRSTQAKLRALGIKICGSGETTAEAWAPSLVEAGAQTVGVLGISCVYRRGWEARGRLPGIAGLRADDYYTLRFPADFCPGVQPIVSTKINPEDKERLAEAIRTMRSICDYVVVSVHWGDFTRPFIITDFERELGRWLVEKGVDAVLGHHQHYFRGFDLFNGTGIFWGLGHIIFDSNLKRHLERRSTAWLGKSDAALEQEFGKFAVFPRSDGFTFNAIGRWTGIAFLEFAECRRTFGIIPTRIAADGRPVIIYRDDAEWPAFLSFLSRCLEETEACICAVDRDFAGAPVLELAVKP